MFDWYGRTQLKNGPCTMERYQLDDPVAVPDGLYLGHDGFVVVHDGKFAHEYAEVIDTTGTHFTAEDVWLCIGRIGDFAQAWRRRHQVLDHDAPTPT